MEMKIGYIAIYNGLGFLSGFILASLLFMIGGYSLPFLTNSGLLGISLVLSIIYVPSEEQIDRFLSFKESEKKRVLEELSSQSKQDNQKTGSENIELSTDQKFPAEQQQAAAHNPASKAQPLNQQLHQ